MHVITRRERFAVAAAVVFGWLPVAAFWVYSKQLRIHDRYSPLIFEFSRLKGSETWIDHLAILYPDALIALTVVPGLMFAAVFAAPRHRALKLTLFVGSALVALLLYANLHSWGTIGRFMTGTAARAAAAFALEQPQMIESYVPLRSLAKLAAILALVAFGVGLLPRWSKRREVGVLLGAATLTSMAAGLAVAGAFASSRMVSLPITRDFVGQSLASLADASDISPTAGFDLKDLDHEFARLTNAPAPTKSPYFGTARDTDLIVFVLETGASRFVDLPGDLASFPTLARLAPRSVIGRSHHSVFPATAESLFALYTSAYPARSLYSTCVVDMAPGANRLPGFLSALEGQGYFTAAYLPFTSVVPLDKAVLGNLGLRKLYYAQEHPRPQGVARDAMALDEMLKDIDQATDRNERYAMVYLPQVGHGPWPDRPANRSIREHGKAIAQIQDQWLGRIVDLLARKGRLDRTTIVFTGDHGIRTTTEDPDFVSGFIDEYSFKVPMLIHSPASFVQRIELAWPTLHLDLSPTLLDLYGLPTSKGAQGAQFWTEGLEQRRLFFLANWYLGADGFKDEKGFAMHSEVVGLAFRNDRLSFNAGHVVHSASESAAIAGAVARLYAIQQQWITSRLCR
jgi:phosphoglycerol transferase MdoB-like AlkP superfamily enzyme